MSAPDAPQERLSADTVVPLFHVHGQFVCGWCGESVSPAKATAHTDHHAALLQGLRESYDEWLLNDGSQRGDNV